MSGDQRPRSRTWTFPSQGNQGVVAANQEAELGANDYGGGGGGVAFHGDDAGPPDADLYASMPGDDEEAEEEAEEEAGPAAVAPNQEAESGNDKPYADSPNRNEDEEEEDDDMMMGRRDDDAYASLPSQEEEDDREEPVPSDIAEIMERMADSDEDEPEQDVAAALDEPERVEEEKDVLDFLDEDTRSLIRRFTEMVTPDHPDHHVGLYVSDEVQEPLPLQAEEPLPQQTVVEKARVTGGQGGAELNTAEDKKRRDMVYKLTQAFNVQTQDLEEHLKTLKRTDVKDTMRAASVLLVHSNLYPLFEPLINGKGYSDQDPDPDAVNQVDTELLRRAMIAALTTLLVWVVKPNYQRHRAMNFPLFWHLLLIAHYDRHQGPHPETLVAVETLLHHCPQLYWSTMRCLLGWSPSMSNPIGTQEHGLTGLFAFVSRAMGYSEVALDFRFLDSLTLNRAIYLLVRLVRLRAGETENYLPRVRLSVPLSSGPLSGSNANLFRLVPTSPSQGLANAYLRFLTSLLTPPNGAFLSPIHSLSADELFDVCRCFMPHHSDLIRQAHTLVQDRNHAAPFSETPKAARVEAPYTLSNFAVSVVPSLYYERYDLWLTWSRDEAGLFILTHPVLMTPWPVRNARARDDDGQPLIAWKPDGSARLLSSDQKLLELVCALSIFLPLTNLQGYTPRSGVLPREKAWEQREFASYFYPLFARHVSALMTARVWELKADRAMLWDPWLLVLMDAATLYRVLVGEQKEQWFKHLGEAQEALKAFDEAYLLPLDHTPPSTPDRPSMKKKPKSQASPSVSPSQDSAFLGSPNHDPYEFKRGTPSTHPRATPNSRSYASPGAKKGTLRFVMRGDSDDDDDDRTISVEQKVAPLHLKFKPPSLANRRKAKAKAKAPADQEDEVMAGIEKQLREAATWDWGMGASAVRWSPEVTAELEELRLLSDKPVIQVRNPFNHVMEDLELDSANDLFTGILKVAVNDDQVFYLSPPVRWGLQCYATTRNPLRFHAVYLSGDNLDQLSIPEAAGVLNPSLQVVRAPETYTQPVFVSETEQGVADQVSAHLLAFHRTHTLRLSPDESPPDQEAESSQMARAIYQDFQSEIQSRRSLLADQVAAAKSTAPRQPHSLLLRRRPRPASSGVSALSGSYEDSLIFQHFSLKAWHEVWSRCLERWRQLLYVRDEVPFRMDRSRLSHMKEAQRALWHHAEQLLSLAKGVLIRLHTAMFKGRYELALDGPEGDGQPLMFFPRTPTEMLSDEEEYDDDDDGEQGFEYEANGFGGGVEEEEAEAEETEVRTQRRSPTESQRQAGDAVVVVDLVSSDDDEDDDDRTVTVVAKE